MKKIFILFIVLIFSCQNTSYTISINGELKKWHKITLTFDGIHSSEYAKEINATFGKIKLELQENQL